VADQAAQAVRARGALTLTLIVVSGAPGTGKSTIARELGFGLQFCVLSLDPIKEALADVLGLGDEDWSNRVAARLGAGRHPIHRDVINPAGVGSADHTARLAATVSPLGLGGPLVDVDTGRAGAGAQAATAVWAAIG
jgi:hypothetical protein